MRLVSVEQVSTEDGDSGDEDNGGGEDGDDGDLSPGIPPTG